MKVFQVLRDCQIIVGSDIIESFTEGKFYITSDEYFQKLSMFIGGAIGIEIPFKEIYNKYEGQDLNGKKLFAMRHGGGGDILFMLTALRELKRIYKDSQIGIAIRKQYNALVPRDDLIYKFHSIPIPLEEWNDYHYHITFENLIENNPDARKYNAYDLFMRQVSLDIKEVPPENKIPYIKLEENERRFKYMEFPHLSNNKKKVGIQIKTSSPIRTYSPYNYIKIGQELVKKGYDVCLFGGEGEKILAERLIKEIGIGSYNVTQSNLRGSIVTASMMNYFIAPDSMFIHIAGAFNIPTIGIYGPFHSETRMKYMKNSVGIDMNVGCSPCLLHGHQSCPKGDPSPCFSLVTPEIVLEAFDRLEEKINESH